MKPSSFEETVRCQFDTLAKRVVDTTVKDYVRMLSRRSSHEVPFSELPAIMLESFAEYDDYEMETTIFNVFGMQTPVSGIEICNALKELPERKRNNVLMFYFLDMSDTEIAGFLKLSRAGVFKNRQSALKEMKRILIKNLMEE